MMAAMITLILTGLLHGARTQRCLVLENLAPRSTLGPLPGGSERNKLAY
jgi:hypothetical protein